MRTTLTLDDDTVDSLKDQAPEFRVVPIHSGFVPGVDSLKLNQLNDQLEAEDFAGPSVDTPTPPG